MAGRQIGVTAILLALGVSQAAWGQDHKPGEQGSRNVHVVSHIPVGWMPGNATDIEIEQELSRPYVYVTRRADQSGFDLISIKDPAKSFVLYRWRIENPQLHRGAGALAPAYLKAKARYYFV